MTWSATRKLTALAWLLLPAACVADDTRVSGAIPENPTREMQHGPPTQSTQSKAKTSAQRLAEHQEKADAAGSSVQKVDPAQARVGVAATHVFHRPDCAQLKDVPPAERILFTSAWEGLDAGYAPCPVCRPSR